MTAKLKSKKLMTKAFLFDSLCGSVYRCMFAGLDEYGHAQWVNITPGDEPKTLEDYVTDEDLCDMRFHVLTMEGETAQSLQVAKVLGKVMECPVGGISSNMASALKRMHEMGVRWDQKPLELTIRVFENSETSKRSGKYTFWVEEKNDECSMLADVDGYITLNELFWTVRSYFLALDNFAGITILSKDLRISDQLKKEVKKSDLAMFGHIENEDFIMKY